MKRMAAVVSAVWALMGAGMGGAQAQAPVEKAGAEQAVKKQTVCPVMGGAINPKIYADAGGKRVYFCCKGCLPEFAKDPAKYISKLEKEGVTLDKAPDAEPAKKQSTDAAAAPAWGCAASAQSAGGCCK